MRVSEFRMLAQGPHLQAVNFIESSCGPMVIEVEFEQGVENKRALIRNAQGEVITCRCITQAYDVCTKVGVHRANLIQVIPHDEACMGSYAEYHRESMPLRF